MTQEDKELLLKDLCARLPYSIKGVISYIREDTIFTVIGICDGIIYLYASEACQIEDFKPCLRPMSSMTEKEKEEFHKLKQFSVTVVMPNGVSRIEPTYIVNLEDDGDGLNHLYDWLNKHHFDYRGLIEKGLALEAHEGMYNY